MKNNYYIINFIKQFYNFIMISNQLLILLLCTLIILLKIIKQLNFFVLLNLTVLIKQLTIKLEKKKYLREFYYQKYYLRLFFIKITFYFELFLNNQELKKIFIIVFFFSIKKANIIFTKNKKIFLKKIFNF